jgi:hypothetical protein
MKAKMASRVKLGWVGAYLVGKTQAAASLNNQGRRSTSKRSQPSCGKSETELNS